MKVFEGNCLLITLSNKYERLTYTKNKTPFIQEVLKKQGINDLEKVCLKLDFTLTNTSEYNRVASVS